MQPDFDYVIASYFIVAIVRTRNEEINIFKQQKLHIFVIHGDRPGKMAYVTCRIIQ